mgnify:CR=1 FL=1
MYGGSRWLFVVNSGNDAATFKVTGVAEGAQVEDAFTGKAVERPQQINLPAYGVAGFKIEGDEVKR